jgi:hypothetical protein
MNEEVVNLFDEVIDATIIVVSNLSRGGCKRLLSGNARGLLEADAFERTVPKILDSKKTRNHFLETSRKLYSQ